jgi:hypothetical protein
MKMIITTDFFLFSFHLYVLLSFVLAGIKFISIQIYTILRVRNVILKPLPSEHVVCMPSAVGACLFETVFCEEKTANKLICYFNEHRSEL